MWKTITRSLFAYIGDYLTERGESYSWIHAYPSDWDETKITVKLSEVQWAYFGINPNEEQS